MRRVVVVHLYRVGMLIAGSVPLEAVLTGLAVRRPVFHSEADFHQAFAWEVQTRDPTLRIRLETRPAPGMRLDLLISSDDGIRKSALELKYLTRQWTGEVGGEHFALKSQGAQDIRAYDVVKDIARVEHFVERIPGANGAVVCLANDSSYWRPPRHTRDTNAAAFRIYEGVRLEGARAWGPNTGLGTNRTRREVLHLRSCYDLAWHHYANLPGEGGELRVLVVPVDERSPTS